MGSGASFLATASAEDKALLARSREELARFFASEYGEMVARGISEEEAKNLFLTKLELKESDMLTNIAVAEALKPPSAAKAAMAEQTESQRNQIFAKQCEQVAQDILAKGAVSYLFCTDGSDASDTALKCLLNMRKKHDSVTIFHASKPNLPVEGSTPQSARSTPASRGREIKTKYEPLVIDLMPKNKYNFHFEERYNRTVLRTIQDYIENVKNHALGINYFLPDFLVLGFVGRKGPKEKQTVLGSTSDLALRTLPMPCIIVKKPCNIGAKSFVMAVKPGRHSQRGLEMLMKLINPRDTLHVLYIKPSSDTTAEEEECAKYYTEELKLHGPAGSKFISINGGGYSSVADAILDQLNGPQGPDFFALAPHAQLRISSITEDIIQRCRCSVILCKN